MRRLTVRTWILLACVTVGGSCNERVPPPQLARSDSAGVTILESSYGPAPEVRVGSRPLLSAPTETGQDYFVQVVDAVLLDDGSLVVIDGGLPAVLRYTVDGSLAWQVGRSGEGPGEYRWLSGVDVLSDGTLVVYDYGLGRLTFLDSDGGVIRTAQLEGAQPGSIVIWQDSLVVGQGQSSRLPAPGLGWTHAEILVWGLDGGLRRRLGSHPRMLQYRLPDGGTGRPLFGPFAALGVVGDQLLFSNGEEVEVRLLDESGRTTRISRIGGYDLSLSPAEIDEEIDLVAEAWGGFEGGSVAQTRRHYREDVPGLERRSAFSRLLVDAAGVAWLGQDRGDLRLRPPNQWELLSPEAGWLGTVRTPDGMSVIHVGRTKLVGITKDQFDVATVALLALDRTEFEAREP